MRQGKHRKPRITVLLVGEGSSEEEFLRHLKSLYGHRDSGVAITIKNARGKGAAHVIDVARRHSHGADFDLKLALLDADKDWNKTTERAARACRVTVLISNPCFEATLLAIHGHPIDGLNSEQLKRQFLFRYGYAASVPSIYLMHFGKDVLDSAGSSAQLIDVLLRTIQYGKV